MGIQGILFVSVAMFSLGLFGVLTRRNALGIFISLELILNSANLNFAAFGRLYGDVGAQVFSLFGIAITVSEVALGFAIVFYLFRLRGTTDADEVDVLRG